MNENLNEIFQLIKQIFDSLFSFEDFAIFFRSLSAISEKNRLPGSPKKNRNPLKINRKYLRIIFNLLKYSKIFIPNFKDFEKRTMFFQIWTK